MGSYLENSAELATGLRSLFSGLTIGKFIKWSITILIILVPLVFFYENQVSSSFYYARLEKRLQIIEKVKELNPNDSAINVAIKSRLLETLNNLNPPKVQYFEILNLDPGTTWNSILKVLGAAILPVLIIISSWNDPDGRNKIIGSIFFMIIFGAIGVFIPVIYSIWVNVFAMPIIQVLTLLPFMARGKT